MGEEMYVVAVHLPQFSHLNANRHEGADKSKPGVFPIQTNWTDNLFFVGREKIGVEYDQGVKVLDHWAFGPHHVWSFPESGQILRMWQPFNGLQVFPGEFEVVCQKKEFKTYANENRLCRGRQPDACE